MKAANRNERRCIGLSCLDGSALISARKTDKSDKHSHISSDGRDTAIDDNDIEKKYFKSTRILSSETKELYKIDQALYAGLIGIPADCRYMICCNVCLNQYFLIFFIMIIIFISERF
jgi:hypothetical protein